MNNGLRLTSAQRQGQTFSLDLIGNFKLHEYTLPDLAIFLHQAAEQNVFIAMDAADRLLDTETLYQGMTGDESLPQDGRFPQRRSSDSDSDDSLRDFEDSSQRHSLRAYLHWQLQGLFLPPDVRDLCDNIVDDLDSQGFFTDSDGFMERNPCAAALFATALAIVKSLDPAGVGCTSMQEGLIEQIGRLGSRCPRGTQLRRLVTHHFDDIIAHRYSAIKRSMGLSEQDLADLLAALGRFHAFPANGFCEGLTHGPVFCDVRFYRRSDGHAGWAVAGNLPNEQVILDEVYLDGVETVFLDAAGRTFLNRQRKQARTIASGITYRSTSLEHLAAFIAHCQERYFVEQEPISPCTMQDAAEELGLSLSAVSRLVKNKYASTPFGTMPLKAFFQPSSTAASSTDVAVSTARIDELIQHVIEHEDPAHPYSDLEIGEILRRSHHLDLSRRTVSKHRLRAGFPPQAKRRRPN